MKKFTVFALPILLLFTALGPVVQPAQAASFPDLYDQHPNEDAFAYLKTEGVFQGYPDGEVKPENRIQRVELAKVIVESRFSDEEIAACTDPGFPDVPAGQWFSDDVCMVKKHGIMEGYPDGTFKMTEYTNFVEAAKIIAEANGLTIPEDQNAGEWFKKYVEALEEKKAIPSTIDFFDDDVTRGEVAEMEYRLEANVTNQVSNTYEQIAQTLPSISSCDALKEKMDNYHYQPPIYYGRGGLMVEGDMVMDEATAEAPSASATAGANGAKASSDSYSQTNVQVEGVDEADIVKNDGKYIYLAKGNTVRIVDAYLPAGMKEVANIDFNQDALYSGFFPRDMFVTGNRLVVIGQATNYYYAKPLEATADSKLFAPPYYNQEQSKIFVYDITDHSAPKKLREVAFDGYYFTSRRIGNQVYLVLNANPNYWNWDKVKTGKDFLPTLKDGEKVAEPMVDCTGIHYFPGYEVPQYMITASVDISTPTAPIKRNVFLGSSDNVYASQTDLFVVGTYNDYNYFTDWDWSKDETKSHVFRFALKDGNIDFIARGEVPGRSLNQFSMDQHNNTFRIATTKGNVWSDTDRSSNNVYVLDAGMKQIGKLENLAPGEQLHSTRFMGDRLYMVTFEQVDPLFVIDLSNPKAPKVLGSLKIPGYSEYLHPYDETHILGFGQETEAVKDNVVVSGFKMSLFDVSDVANPKQMDSVVLGDSGTYSELLYNHKALLFDKEKGLISFPIQIQEKVQPQDLQCSQFTKSTCPSNCIQACVSKDGQCADIAGSCVAPTYEQYQTTFVGAMVYHVDLTDGFKELARITHLTEEDMQKMGSYWYDYNKMVQRALYIGNYLYTVAQGSIKASDMTDWKEVNMVELTGGDDYGQPIPVDVMM